MKRIVLIIVGILALSMSLFHIYSGGVKLFPALQQRSIHLGLAFALIFLTYPILKKKQEEQSNLMKISSDVINILLAIAAFYVGYYIMSQYMTLPMEILSPSTRNYDLIIKRTAYAQAGVPEYWVFRPRERDVLVHSDPEPATGLYLQVTHIPPDGELVSPTLPFRTPVSSFFPDFPVRSIDE